MLRAITFNGIPITPSSISLPSGGSFDLYNTADQTTNYERLRADWSGNVARIYTQAAGTGTVRGMSIATGTYAGTSGTTTALTVNPTINQSGTAGYTALDVNPTESATGSGTKLLQRWAVGGTTRALLRNDGNFAVSGGLFSGYLAFGGTPTNISGDVVIVRDGANVLALQNSTNDQTFRVYNTYTDASNYERGALANVSNDLWLLTQNAGTGSARALVFGTANSGRWSVSTNGHFLAFADNTYDIGASGATRPRTGYFGTSVVTPYLAISDGIAAPGAGTGVARIYVDTADGDLKIIFGDGTIKTIVTDT